MTKPGAKLLAAPRLNGRQLRLFGALFGVIGAAMVVRIFAAGTPTAFEAESGALTSPAAVVSDATASGGAAVKFGSGSITNGT